MGGSAKRKIGIVTDGVANLSEDFAKEHHIEIARYSVWFPDEEEEIEDTKALYQRMRQTKKMPRTAAPSPLMFKKIYKKTLEKFDKVLVILLFKELSAAFNSATQAKNRMSSEERERIEIFDSHLAAAAEGLVVWKAQELIDQGKGLVEILEILKEFRNNVKLLGFMEDLVWLVHGGRLHEPWATPALLLQKAGIRPAIGILNGQVKTTGLKLFAKDRVPVILKELRKASRKAKIGIAITHADIPEEVLMLKHGIEGLDVELLFVSQLTPVVGAHTGPGTILVGYYFM